MQRRSGGRLGAILVGTGAIDGPTLRAARAVQTGLPPVSAAAVATPLLPADRARAMRAVALAPPPAPPDSGVEDRVVVALADPCPDALRELSAIVGGPVEPLVVDEPSLVTLLERAYRDEDQDAVARTLARRRRDVALRACGATAIAAVTVVAGLLDPRALLAATAGTGALVLFARAYRQSLEVQARRTAGTPNGADERQAVEADLPSCTVVVPLPSRAPTRWRPAGARSPTCATRSPNSRASR